MANLQSVRAHRFQQVKADLHRKILDRLDLEKTGQGNRRPRHGTRSWCVIRNAVNSEVVPLSFCPSANALSRNSRRNFCRGLAAGALLERCDRLDILVNRFDKVYVERPGNSKHRLDLQR